MAELNEIAETHEFFKISNGSDRISLHSFFNGVKNQSATLITSRLQFSFKYSQNSKI